MKKLMLIGSTLLLLAGCATGLEDGLGSYSGKGKVVSIVMNEEGNSEIDVETTDKKHIPVIVSGEVAVYPGQAVSIKRNSRGFGSVTAL
ncbi:hypothetical protein WMO13_06020 [Ignatzschineria larvae DSM 13226]|uniref:DUF3221 domain-containing protein n=1 Tax=Ignatzschineria larvae DSM 13226 TaxID=1111732 RepID=A0ABZ3BXJ1_9GAMM|nr:hypothetical protein [Ignatzschineria larvae]